MCIAEVESLLERREDNSNGATYVQDQCTNASSQQTHYDSTPPIDEIWPNTSALDAASSGCFAEDDLTLPDTSYASVPPLTQTSEPVRSDNPSQTAYTGSSPHNTSWELHAMGLEESLPDQRAIDEL